MSITSSSNTSLVGCRKSSPPAWPLAPVCGLTVGRSPTCHPLPQKAGPALASLQEGEPIGAAQPQCESSLELKLVPHPLWPELAPLFLSPGSEGVPFYTGRVPSQAAPPAPSR